MRIATAFAVGTIGFAWFAMAQRPALPDLAVPDAMGMTLRGKDQSMNPRSLSSATIRFTLSSTSISCVGKIKSACAGGSNAAVTPGNCAILPASAIA